MIDYNKVKRGDILRVTDEHARLSPNDTFASTGDLLRVVKQHHNSVLVENRAGKEAEFMFNCGAARLEETEWKEDFPNPEVNHGVCTYNFTSREVD